MSRKIEHSEYCLSASCPGEEAHWVTATDANPPTSGDDERDSEEYAVANEQATLNIERLKSAFLAGRKGMVPEIQCLRRIEKVVIEMRQAQTEAVRAEQVRVANDALKTMREMITAHPIHRQKLEDEFYQKYFGVKEQS